MRSLAGHPEATAIFRDELTAAGCAFVDVSAYGEPKCTIVGTVALPGGFALRVERAWVYHVVTIVPPLPVALARAVNASPCDIEGNRYSGDVGTLGAVARTDGYAGGRSDAEITCPVEHWHVDHPDALAPLIGAISRAVEAHGYTAEGAAAEDRAQWTEALLDELASLAPTSSAWRRCVREMMTSERTDWTSPRLVAMVDALAGVV